MTNISPCCTRPFFIIISLDLLNETIENKHTGYVGAASIPLSPLALCLSLHSFVFLHICLFPHFLLFSPHAEWLRTSRICAGHSTAHKSTQVAVSRCLFRARYQTVSWTNCASSCHSARLTSLPCPKTCASADSITHTPISLKGRISTCFASLSDL